MYEKPVDIQVYTISMSKVIRDTRTYCSPVNNTKNHEYLRFTVTLYSKICNGFMISL